MNINFTEEDISNLINNVTLQTSTKGIDVQQINVSSKYMLLKT